MRRIKVYNMIFSNAGMSFHNLRLYYEHVVALFDQSNKRASEFRQKMQEEYERKGQEYETEIMRNFHKFYDEICPNYFHNSFLITACSLFEQKAKELWDFIEKEHQVPIEWDDFKDPVPTRFRKLLNFTGVVLKDGPPRIELPPPDFQPAPVYPEDRFGAHMTWRTIVFYYRIRNCIVHNNCKIENARGSSTLERFATENNIKINNKGRLEIQLNEEFNIQVCLTMKTVFDKLGGAYYNVPLPD